jgi:HAE1 family hydrophobic/amphiphilic exporter-1
VPLVDASESSATTPEKVAQNAPRQGALIVDGSISAPFIRHPIATSLLMIGVLFAGISRLSEATGRAAAAGRLPHHSGFGTASRRQPRHNSFRCGRTDAFAQIPGVAQMTLDEHVWLDRDHHPVRPRPRHRRGIERRRRRSICQRTAAEEPAEPADLPEGESGGFAILLLAATSETRRSPVDDNVEQTRPADRQVSGVAQVLVGGQQKPAVRIQLDPAKLVAKGLSLEDVRMQLSVATVDSPKGSIDGATRSFTIYTNDQLTQAKPWNDVIVAYRNNGPLRVRDIGVAVTEAEDMKQAAWADGKRGVFLVVFKQPGANVIATVDRIMAALPRLEAAMPPAIKIFTLSDRTQTIRASVHDVQFTLLLTIALVVMVIFPSCATYGRRSSRASRCRWRCSAPARSCGSQGTASTICR